MASTTTADRAAGDDAFQPREPAALDRPLPAKLGDSLAAPAEPAKAVSTRLVSLDAYRGFIMLAMASAGLRINEVVSEMVQQKLVVSSFWRAAAYQTEHTVWVGCSFWDLIQPSFMFMVGVAMPFSYSVRAAKGHGYASLLRHALVRSVVLVLLGIFLSSNGAAQPEFTFVNVLTQIGLGYPLLFLLWNRPAWVQGTAAAVILVVYWGAFAAYSPPADLDTGKIGWEQEYQPLTGFAAHWNKNANVAAAADLGWMNWFPRKAPFVFNKGGYQTLNFVPSLATMILGLLAGGLLRSNRPGQRKFLLLVAAGLAGLTLGWLLDLAGICPLVKRIWTPSWAIFSTGWTCLMLAAFYGLVDLVGWRRWTYPLVVVGMNSIAMYCMSQLLKSWVWQTIRTHFYWTPRTVAWSGGEAAMTQAALYLPIVQASATLLVLWLVCWWMYRNKIFVRI